MRHNKQKITTVSFDADGTLITPSFADLMWLEVLPQCVSDSWNIPLHDAKAKLFADYDSIGSQKMEWYDLSYWIKRYRLEILPKNMVAQYKAAVTLYPEVEEVLDSLKERYDLIVVSNSARLFLDITTESLKGYFKQTFSTVTDLGMMKGIPAYHAICEKLNVRPYEIAHIGDSLELDYTRARKAGLKAYFLDRVSRRKGRYFVSNLKDFKLRLDG